MGNAVTLSQTNDCRLSMEDRASLMAVILRFVVIPCCPQVTLSFRKSKPGPIWALTQSDVAWSVPAGTST